MFEAEPKDLSIPENYRLLVGGIGPRPIALVSTLNPEGKSNLAPFSFFNAFGINPPMVAFSATKRGRDGTYKNTYDNIQATRECTIQVVTYPIVEQVNLSAIEYPAQIDEFIKSGLTPVDSDLVAPKRVAESPFQMECKLWKMVELGGKPASGNLAICEVIKFHVAEDVFGPEGLINPHRIDLVGRMGANFYSRTSGTSAFEVPRIKEYLGMGYDELPSFMKNSHIYSANDLGRFATAERAPTIDEAEAMASELEEVADPSLEAIERHGRQGEFEEMLSHALGLAKENHPLAAVSLERTAQCALRQGRLDFAWKAALMAGEVHKNSLTSQSE